MVGADPWSGHRMTCKRLRIDMRIVRSTDFPRAWLRVSGLTGQPFISNNTSITALPPFNWVGAFHIDRTAHWPYVSHRVMGARLLA